MPRGRKNYAAADSRARRAARKVGLIARKSRRRSDNGQLMLVDENNWLVAGGNYTLTADDVVDFCQTFGPAHD